MLDTLTNEDRKMEVLKSFAITRIIRATELIILMLLYFSNRNIIEINKSLAIFYTIIYVLTFFYIYFLLI